MNYSVQRKKIIDYLSSVTTHPTAYEIYQNVKKDLPNISLGTVYRNLDALENAGKILKIKGANADRYDGNFNKHYHAICEKCGKVYDISDNYDFNLDKKVQNNNEFEVLYHELVFHIICKNCKK